jgi:3-phosphoshikimate 1-carboxyvinyltransferase
MEKRITKSNGLRGTVTVPGDKSISHRALMISALANGQSEITGLLNAADPTSTRTCLRTLGIECDWSGNVLRVHGRGLRGLQAPKIVLDAGNSGTTIRLLSGILAGQPFSSSITGDASLRTRPMKRIIDPLKLMGAQIDSTTDGTPPLGIHGVSPLHPIDYQMPMSSAQVKSAVLLAGLFAAGTTRVSERTATRDHTERMLGLKTTRSAEGHTVEIDGGREIAPGRFQVPGDISSAAFIVSAALIVPGSEVTIRNVGLNPTRARILDFYRSLGASISILDEHTVAGEPIGDLSVKSTALQGDVWLDAHAVAELIDEIPVIAVTLALSGAGLTVHGAADLRAKESDRIWSIVDNLRRMGGEVEEYPDGFAFQATRSFIPARCDSYGDHRIAMAFGIAGLALEGETIIDNADCVEISFPEFWSLLDSIQVHSS